MKPGNRGERRCQVRQGNLEDEKRLLISSLPASRGDFFFISLTAANRKDVL